MVIVVAVALGLVLFAVYLGYLLLMIGQSKRSDLLRQRVMSGYSPFVSVVVPTYNEEATIPHKMKNLAGQDYRNMELIVVDSASTDRTVELVERVGKECGLNPKIIEEEKREGLVKAEQTAFQHCQGEIVVLSDADALWDKGALTQALSNFKDPTIGAVCGRQILLNRDQNSATAIEGAYRDIYEIMRTGESALDSTPIFHGEIGCYRKELIDRLREDTIADDSTLAVHVRKKGFRSIYDPRACFYEYASPGGRWRYVQKIRRAQGLAQMFIRERDILFKRKYGSFGMIIFPAEFFMHIVSPFLVFAFLLMVSWTLIAVSPYLFATVGLVVVALLFVPAISRRSLLNFVPSFLEAQSTLLVSIVFELLGKSQHKWKMVDGVRDLWRTHEQANLASTSKGE